MTLLFFGKRASFFLRPGRLMPGSGNSCKNGCLFSKGAKKCADPKEYQGAQFIRYLVKNQIFPVKNDLYFAVKQSFAKKRHDSVSNDAPGPQRDSLSFYSPQPSPPISRL
jgi:hypothetical protein